MLGAVLGVVDSSQSYFLGNAIGVVIPWPRVLVTNVIYWIAFAALVPGVFFLVSRFRLDGPQRYWRIAIHGVGAVLFTVMHAALYLTLTFWLPPLSSTATRATIFISVIRDYAAADFLSYWAVVASFYMLHYYRESQRREIAAARLQMTLTETRLQVLRSQLNPHFLFNTLNSISTLALKGDHQATVDMLARLSDLLRVSLDDRCPQEVSLSKELEFLELYLAIQRIRFADRLNIRQRVPPDVLDALVPSMILQPLAENAIRYGIDAHCGRGVITIESERQNGQLVLRVRDSGPGFPLEGTRPRIRPGVGLANTHARLEQLYGPHQQLVFGRSEEGGGIVTVTIPFHTVDDVRA